MGEKRQRALQWESEVAWSNVRPGLSEQEVLSLLGYPNGRQVIQPPADVAPSVVWTYQRGDPDGAVVFRDGVVIAQRTPWEVVTAPPPTVAPRTKARRAIVTPPELNREASPMVLMIDCPFCKKAVSVNEPKFNGTYTCPYCGVQLSRVYSLAKRGTDFTAIAEGLADELKRDISYIMGLGIKLEKGKMVAQTGGAGLAGYEAFTGHWLTARWLAASPCWLAN